MCDNQYCFPKMMAFVVWAIFAIISPYARPDDVFITPQVHTAVARGLDYLIRHQNLSSSVAEDHGSFTDRAGRKYSIATTSFACLSLLANGNLPNRGRYGGNLAYGLEFLLRCVNPNGYVSRLGDDSRMHGHGFAVLVLAEIYGMSPNRKDAQIIFKKLKKATELILQSQTPDGGWGYLPTDNFHEGSMTVCQLQALRASRNVGIRVPKKNIKLAIEYLRKSANPDGTFKYRLGMNTQRQSFPLTAAGVSSLNATGEYESKEVKRGLNFMMQYLPPWGKQDRYYRAFYYYGQFYAAQAMYHAHQPEKHWNRWYPAVRDDLLKKQDAGGAWGKSTSRGYSRFGSVYATSIATLILQIPYNYLPIFQK